MSSQEHIQDELNSLSLGLPFNNNQPFSVPEGYFEGFAASVLAKLKSSETFVSSELQELSPLLASIPKKMPYSVPSSYFTENEAGVASMYEEVNSPVLEVIGKEMLYSIPQGYFLDLADDILAKVVEPKAKVVPLFARKWMRIASAAVVGSAMALAGYQYFGNEQKSDIASAPPTNPETIMANAPAIQQEIKKASTEELKAFIKNVQVAPVKEISKETASSDNSKVKEMLKDVSDEDMENFLSAISPSDDELSATN